MVSGDIELNLGPVLLLEVKDAISQNTYTLFVLQIRVYN
jgi:hypothetical protein